MAIRNSALLCAAVLSACAVQPFDENSRFSAIPTGSILGLNQVIDIAADQVSVYLQAGRVMAYKEINYYLPHCKFELYSIAEQPRKVQPDEFVVTQVVDYTEMTSLRPVTTASLLTANDGYDIVTYTTIIYLKSVKQADVYRMSCMHWDDMANRRYLSISQMRKAMGEVFSLKINRAGVVDK